MPGAATLTPAIVVGAIRYGETSRIVRIATRDLGVVGAIAKGALRPRSRFGTSLQLLAEGVAHVIPGRGELATLAAFDPTDMHTGLARLLPAFLAASALAEIAARVVPPVAQEEIFETLRDGVRMLEHAPEAAVEVVALRVIWRLVDVLGHAPALEACARDGVLIPPGPAAFSLGDGGVLCRRCDLGASPIRLEADDRLALAFFVDGRGEAPELDPPHAAAHRRLLARWIVSHLSEGELPALELWRRGNDSATRRG